MIRGHLFHKRVPFDPLFRWRGGDVSRLEGLSDGVFAITLTLIVVSLQVPSSYVALLGTILDAPVFLLCFAVLMIAWRYHYIFFRRYGLEDLTTQVLNAAFLFFILLYAYPLKFLATFLWGVIRGIDRKAQALTLFHDPDQLLSVAEQKAGMTALYGFGLLGIFGVLTLMVWHAWRKRDYLELDQLERALTLSSLRAHIITSGVAALSLCMLWRGVQPGFAGISYFLIAPLQTANGFMTGHTIRRLKREQDLTTG